MNESNTPAANVNIWQLQKGSLAEHQRAVHEGVKYPCGKYQFQATTNTNVADVNIKQLIKDVSLNIKEQ